MKVQNQYAVTDSVYQLWNKYDDKQKAIESADAINADFHLPEKYRVFVSYESHLIPSVQIDGHKWSSVNDFN